MYSQWPNNYSPRSNYINTFHLICLVFLLLTFFFYDLDIKKVSQKVSLLFSGSRKPLKDICYWQERKMLRIHFIIKKIVWRKIFLLKYKLKELFKRVIKKSIDCWYFNKRKHSHLEILKEREREKKRSNDTKRHKVTVIPSLKAIH